MACAPLHPSPLTVKVVQALPLLLSPPSGPPQWPTYSQCWKRPGPSTSSPPLRSHSALPPFPIIRADQTPFLPSPKRPLTPSPHLRPSPAPFILQTSLIPAYISWDPRAIHPLTALQPLGTPPRCSFVPCTHLHLAPSLTPTGQANLLHVRERPHPLSPHAPPTPTPPRPPSMS